MSHLNRIKPLIGTAALAVSMAFACAVANPASAGEGSIGNGGGAFICPGHPERNELLDLWEAGMEDVTFSKPLRIVRSDQPLDAQIGDAFAKLSRLNPLLAGAAGQAYVRALRERKEIDTRNEELDFPADALSTSRKRGCDKVGVALYEDAKNRLKIDKTALGALPITDQAALWLHESVYRALRDTSGVGHEDSRRARKIVGILFSDHEPALSQPRDLPYALVCRPGSAVAAIGGNEYSLSTDGRGEILVRTTRADPGKPTAAYRGFSPEFARYIQARTQTDSALGFCPGSPEQPRVCTNPSGGGPWLDSRPDFLGIFSLTRADESIAALFGSDFGGITVEAHYRYSVQTYREYVAETNPRQVVSPDDRGPAAHPTWSMDMFYIDVGGARCGIY